MLRSEQGVALTVAIFTLAVIALFSALVASTAGHLGDTSNDDRDSKRALGVAESGVNTALHRVNNGPLTTSFDCFADNIEVGVQNTTIFYEAAGNVRVDAGHCPGDTGRAGNDSMWTYWITKLNNDDHCDEQYDTNTQLSPSGDPLFALSVQGISVLRRCITAIGNVNGVLRRLQREVYSEFRLFYGLIGTERVFVEDLASVTSHVGSNKHVTMQPNSVFDGQIEVLEGAEVVVGASLLSGVTYRPDPWIIDPIDVPDGDHDNTGITCKTALLLDCGASSWDESTDKLVVGTGQTATFEGGRDYNLCEFTVNGGTVTIGGSGVVRVFIRDGCGGQFQINGGLVNAASLSLEQQLELAGRLQVYVNGAAPIYINGGATATANVTLFAPEAHSVTIRRNGGLLAPTVYGSISAPDISVLAESSFFGAPLLDITTPFEQIAGQWHAGDWSECPAKPTVEGDPHSGCIG